MRIRVASRQGVLDVEASEVDTSLSSPGFADLPAVSGLASPPVEFLPLILDPGAAVSGVAAEVVYVTDHVEGSSTVTVLRGQEQDRGAAAPRIHADGTEWHHGPTPGDWDDEILGSAVTEPQAAIHMARVLSLQIDTDIRNFRRTPGVNEVTLTLIQGTVSGGLLVPAFKGSWDATTNTPTLVDGVGTEGDWYLVAAGDDVDLGSGTKTFTGGQAAVYDGAEWQPVADLPGDPIRIMWDETGGYTPPTLGTDPFDIDSFRLICADGFNRTYWVGQRLITALPFAP